MRNLIYSKSFSFYLLLITSSILLLSSCQEKQEKIKPVFQDITESVYASVILQPKDLYYAYPSVNGVIEKIWIEENQLVQKNEKLAQIRNTSPQVNIEKAQLNTQLAQQNFERQNDVLEAIEDEMSAATLKFKTDSINYERQQRLWKENIGSQIDLDNRKLAYDLSKNNISALQNKLETAKIEMANQLKTQIQIAENTLKASQVTNSDFIIKSELDGKVYSVLKNPGETVLVQEPLAAIGDKEEFVIEMEVDEVDIARLAKDQKVLITLDAYGKEVFEAKLSKIYPQKQERTQTFKVEADFIKAPETLYPGLSGEANIVISKKPNVIIIPLNYLVESNKVNTENGLVEVETGIRDMQRIEIISGIDTSTYILKPQ